jgi:cytochrome c556
VQDSVPPVTDERNGLLVFLSAQREALRSSVKGLSEFQAHQIASASTMSLATLLHHVNRIERRWTQVAIAGRAAPDIWPVTDPAADFRLAPDERISAILDAYAATAGETDRIVAGVFDLGQHCAEASFSDVTVRWVLLHLLEETARHAGHADIIRESIDGASATMLRGR